MISALRIGGLGTGASILTCPMSCDFVRIGKPGPIQTTFGKTSESLTTKNELREQIPTWQSTKSNFQQEMHLQLPGCFATFVFRGSMYISQVALLSCLLVFDTCYMSLWCAHLQGNKSW